MGSLHLDSRAAAVASPNMIGLVLLLVASAAATSFDDCGSRATGITVDLKGCDTPPCKFSKGSTVEAEISFTETAAAESYKNNIHAIVAGIPLPWPGFDTAVCDKLTEGDCPGEAGEKLTYHYQVEIAQEYPKVSLVIDWHMEDNNGDNAVCFQIPAEIVD